MPAGVHGAIAGAASMSRRKRLAPKVLRGRKRGRVRNTPGNRMDREMNTPRGGQGPTKIYGYSDPNY